VFDDGENYLLADGYHRWHAHRALEHTSITATVIEGSRERYGTHSGRTPITASAASRGTIAELTNARSRLDLSVRPRPRACITCSNAQCNGPIG
jgi:hypothetical protein